MHTTYHEHTTNTKLLREHITKHTTSHLDKLAWGLDTPSPTEKKTPKLRPKPATAQQDLQLHSPSLMEAFVV